jgi:hypothetical protein
LQAKGNELASIVMMMVVEERRRRRRRRRRRLSSVGFFFHFQLPPAPTWIRTNPSFSPSHLARSYPPIGIVKVLNSFGVSALPSVKPDDFNSCAYFPTCAISAAQGRAVQGRAGRAKAM